jgi:hypothetical protein
MQEVEIFTMASMDPGRETGAFSQSNHNFLIYIEFEVKSIKMELD